MWYKFPDEKPPIGFIKYPVWVYKGFIKYCMWSPETLKWYSNDVQGNFWEEYPHKIVAWYDIPLYTGENKHG